MPRAGLVVFARQIRMKVVRVGVATAIIEKHPGSEVSATFLLQFGLAHRHIGARHTASLAVIASLARVEPGVEWT